SLNARERPLMHYFFHPSVRAAAAQQFDVRLRVWHSVEQTQAAAGARVARENTDNTQPADAAVRINIQANMGGDGRAGNSERMLGIRAQRATRQKLGPAGVFERGGFCLVTELERTTLGEISFEVRSAELDAMQ